MFDIKDFLFFDLFFSSLLFYLNMSMSILGSVPLFGLFGSSTKSKHDRLRKSMIPISSVLKRQPFSTSSQRALPNKSSSYQQRNADNRAGPEVITESSILNSFPRPNLMPTLHFSLFGSPNNDGKKTASKCTNCSGPHSTDFCPC